jgi:hypothetical protein
VPHNTAPRWWMRVRAILGAKNKQHHCLKVIATKVACSSCGTGLANKSCRNTLCKKCCLANPTVLKVRASWQEGSTTRCHRSIDIWKWLIVCVVWWSCSYVRLVDAVFYMYTSAMSRWAHTHRQRQTDHQRPAIFRNQNKVGHFQIYI